MYVMTIQDPLGTSAASPGRTPPADVRRHLRKEAGFVCAVPDCGSPYLEYHHFDPPWSDGRQHRPEGMIALCAGHHKHADGGAFTVQQLRNWKSAPNPQLDISSKLQWRREQAVFRLGSNMVASCEVILECGGRPIIWLTKDQDGFELINLDIFDSNGRIAFQMRDNDWITGKTWDDLEVPPRGRSLAIRSEEYGISLSLKFSSATVPDLCKILGYDAPAQHLSPGEKLLCDLSGSLVWPRRLVFTESSSNMDGIIVSNCFLGSGRTGFSL
jgi:hypothetical protein